MLYSLNSSEKAKVIILEQRDNEFKELFSTTELVFQVKRSKRLAVGVEVGPELRAKKD